MVFVLVSCFTVSSFNPFKMVREKMYMNDYRVRAQDKWYDEFDNVQMQATAFDLVLPCKYEVCPTCGGQGSHVNPSIDCDGISSEDFDRDPGFREEYMAGVYDVRCYGCDGKRVVPEVDRQRCSKELLAQFDEALEDYDADNYERDAERRMGA